MHESKIYKRAETINIRANSNKEFFLVHGYTGSPTDFSGLENSLHRRFRCNVKIPRLKGHGQTVYSLDGIHFDDFFKQIEEEIKKDLKKGRKMIIGGYSFGGSLALYLASKYPVHGVFSVSTPYKLKFPFNIKGIGLVRMFGKYWKKIIPKYEKKMREGAFYYDKMHANGLDLTNDVNRLLNKSFKKITAPCLLINSNKGPLDHSKTADIIKRNISSKIKKSTILESESHSLFFSKENGKIEEVIGDFFEKNVFE